MAAGRHLSAVYTARDALEHDEWLEAIDVAADDLGLGEGARARARDLFLSTVPEAERSKPVALAASLYAGALLAGDQRSQVAVAEAVGVSRLALQRRWKDQLEAAGLEPPDW